MKKWNRINRTDKNKEKLGKIRIVVRGFMNEGLQTHKRVKQVIVVL